MESLKNAIAQSGMHQYEVAAAAQLTETRLSRITCGRCMPTADEQRALAKALKTSVRVLFGRRSPLGAK